MDEIIVKTVVDINLLKTAFRKLLTYAYFDKSDMVLRHNVALFATKLERKDEEDAVFGAAWISV